jgi:hypothetical protein
MTRAHVLPTADGWAVHCPGCGEEPTYVGPDGHVRGPGLLYCSQCAAWVRTPWRGGRSFRAKAGPAAGRLVVALVTCYGTCRRAEEPGS